MCLAWCHQAWFRFNPHATTPWSRHWYDPSVLQNIQMILKSPHRYPNILILSWLFSYMGFKVPQGHQWYLLWVQVFTVGRAGDRTKSGSCSTYELKYNERKIMIQRSQDFSIKEIFLKLKVEFLQKLLEFSGPSSCCFLPPFPANPWKFFFLLGPG